MCEIEVAVVKKYGTLDYLIKESKKEFSVAVNALIEVGEFLLNELNRPFNQNVEGAEFTYRNRIDEVLLEIISENYKGSEIRSAVLLGHKIETNS